MLEISIPIIVEGKYDRERVLSVAKATVITTDGFGIFKKDEKAAKYLNSPETIIFNKRRTATALGLSSAIIFTEFFRRIKFSISIRPRSGARKNARRSLQKRAFWELKE